MYFCELFPVTLKCRDLHVEKGKIIKICLSPLVILRHNFREKPRRNCVEIVVTICMRCLLQRRIFLLLRRRKEDQKQKTVIFHVFSLHCQLFELVHEVYQSLLFLLFLSFHLLIFLLSQLLLIIRMHQSYEISNA